MEVGGARWTSLKVLSESKLGGEFRWFRPSKVLTMTKPPPRGWGEWAGLLGDTGGGLLSSLLLRLTSRGCLVKGKAEGDKSGELSELEEDEQEEGILRGEKSRVFKGGVAGGSPPPPSP